MEGAADPQLMDVMGIGPLSGPHPDDGLKGAAVQAAGQLVSNVVRAIEPMLFVSSKRARIETSPVFYLGRHTDDGMFTEVAAVDFDSGTIVTSNVTLLWVEPYGAVDDWIVDPYFGSNMRLTPDEYGALIEKLDERYDVRFVQDVRTAHFFGAKGTQHTSPPPRAPDAPNAPNAPDSWTSAGPEPGAASATPEAAVPADHAPPGVDQPQPDKAGGGCRGDEAEP